MKGYLFDTNAISRWYSGNASIRAKIDGLSDDVPLCVSMITLGEMQFGDKITTTTDQAKRDEFKKWFRDKFPVPFRLTITEHTTECYGDIRSQLFKQFPPCGKRENHPEMCFDKVMAKELGIDENDLWIAAQAIEHNLILVSNDRMNRIQTAAGRELYLEDWENNP